MFSADLIDVLPSTNMGCLDLSVDLKYLPIILDVRSRYASSIGGSLASVCGNGSGFPLSSLIPVQISSLSLSPLQDVIDAFSKMYLSFVSR